MLMVSEVRCKDDNLFIFWDFGLNIFLIFYIVVKCFNMKGIDVIFCIFKVGNIIEYFYIKEYIIFLIDVEGEIW